MRHVQLRAFHHVALHGGFSRAAAALGLTQPAISDQVRRLEEAYGVVLFDRRRRQVTLTEAGERLFEITRRLFAAEAEAHELLAERRALRAGRLCLVADSVHHVVAVLRAFRARYPGIELVVRSGNSAAVLAALRDYRAEVGVVGGVAAGEDLLALPLSATPLVAFVRRDHPLATHPRLTLAEVAREPLVLREAGSKTREQIERVAADRGLALVPAIEAEGREAVREIVAAGGGVGIVSAAEFGEDPRLVAIPIADCPAVMEEYLVCLAERAAARPIAAFFEVARATLAEARNPQGRASREGAPAPTGREAPASAPRAPDRKGAP